jgi:hypothetical protein
MTEMTLVRLEERPTDVHDGRLGRHIEHDPKSRNHDVEARSTVSTVIRPVLWARYSPILDQGNLGSCTGNALTGWLGCAPHALTPQAASPYDEPFAVKRYERATATDTFSGTYPPDDTGSSGLAVCKAAKKDGIIGSYAWAFTVSGLLRALQHGPVIVGTPWLEGFDRPDSSGLVLPTGSSRGGHEYLIRGVQPARAGGPIDGSAPLWGDNSWGVGFGVNGSFHYTVDAWAKLRAQQADCTVPHV